MEFEFEATECAELSVENPKLFQIIKVNATESHTIQVYMI